MKLLANVKQDEDLKIEMNRLKEISRHIEDRKKFLIKQINDLKKWSSDQMTPTMKQVEELLIKKNLLEENYDKEKFVIIVNDFNEIYLKLKEPTFEHLLNGVFE